MASTIYARPASHDNGPVRGAQLRRAAAFGTLALIMVLFIVDVPLGLAIMNAPATTTSASYGGGGNGQPSFAFAIPMLGLAVLATIIVLRRQGNRIGWLLLGAVVFVALQGVAADYGTYAINIQHRALPGGDLAAGLGDMLWLPFVGMVLVLPLQLFPDGRPVSRRWRWLLWATIGAIVVGYFANTFAPSTMPGVHFPRASGVLGTILKRSRVLLLLFALCALASFASLIVRYRRSGSEVRHQARWLILSGILYAVPFTAYGVIGLVTGVYPAPLAATSVLGLVSVPFAMSIAVLKYRLYDIDVIISRAVVYGSLAAGITAVYVAIVVGVGTLLGSGGRPNLLLSIAATAIVAAGFQPVRERLQRFANRLVYGKRATPYEVLSQFSQRVAETYAAEDALPRMARVLAEGTSASRADVWLRSEGELRRAASWPDLADAATPVLDVTGQLLPAVPGDHVIAVRHQGDLLGALSVTKRQGEALTPIEAKLVDDLGHQAGLVLKNVGLTAELLARLDDLRASRKRLVAAQDAERRRLERNLHDGAQQNLVALKVKLGLAETLADRDPEKARDLIVQLKADADEALDTLRDLARGIYPPLLADRGLEAALEAQARKATLPVAVEATGLGRYPQDVEAAVYFCTMEMLQNVQKYAGATSARVTVVDDGRQLSFSVVDDGAGFDVAQVKRGAGLQNMEDRLDSLGGALDIVSAPGHGTTVSGRLPHNVTASQPEAVLGG